MTPPDPSKYPAIPNSLQAKALATMAAKYPTAKVGASLGWGYVAVNVDGYPYPFSVLATNPIESAVAKMVGFGVIETDPVYLGSSDVTAIRAEISPFLSDCLVSLGLPPVTIYSFMGAY